MLCISAQIVACATDTTSQLKGLHCVCNIEAPDQTCLLYTFRFVANLPECEAFSKCSQSISDQVPDPHEVDQKSHSHCAQTLHDSLLLCRLW